MKHFTILILLFFHSLTLFAQSQNLASKKEIVQMPTPELSYKFIQNQRQWHESVLYKATIPNGSLFMKQTSIIYSFLDPVTTSHQHDDLIKNENTNLSNHEHEKKEEPKEKIKGHGVEVEFLGANQQTSISPEGESTENYNYFIGNNPTKWASNLKGYSNLTYQKLYNGIDMRFYTDNKSLKYEFRVAPQTNPHQIQLKYKGATKLSLDTEGNLQIGTSVLDFIEQKPYCYQIIEGEKREVKSKFVLKDSTITFELSEYNLAYELVIDPELIFASYTSNMLGAVATFDNQGYLYTAGLTGNSGPNTLNPTIGAYDVTDNGGTDMGICKFDIDGKTVKYVTYLGGSGTDLGMSLIVNSAGNLVILATSNSANCPTLTNSYDRTFNGNNDLYVAVLNNSGSNLLAATYIGGTNAEGSINVSTYLYSDDSNRGEVNIDTNDNIYIASCTNSADFPTRTTNIGSLPLGGQDGVLVSLNKDLSTLRWSTRVGGLKDDVALSVQVGTNGEVYVAGSTLSNNVQLSASPLQTYQGGIDGFIQRYSASGLFLGGTYVGSPNQQMDYLYMMDLDLDGDVYVLGNTNGVHPVTTGKYRVGGGHFLYKFNANLTQKKWSTVLGATGNTRICFSPTAFMVSDCKMIYLSGWAGRNGLSVTGMPTTTDAYRRTSFGDDFYLMALDAEAVGLLYASYFGNPSGGNHAHNGFSRFDKQGTLYQTICDCTGGMPTTPGVFMPTSPSGCNGAVFKFDLNPIFPDFDIIDNITGNIVPEGLFCFPITIKLKNKSRGSTGTYFWDLGIFGTSTAFEPIVTITAAGLYPFKLKVNSGNCQKEVTKTLRTEQVAALVSPSITLCVGSSTQLTANGGTSYRWTPTTGLNNPNIANPIATPLMTTTYSVRINYANRCFKDTTVTINVRPLTVANFTTTTNFCTGAVSFTNTSANGGIYSWDFGNGQTSTLQNPAPVVYTSGNYIVRLTVTTPTSCPTTITRTITVNRFSPDISQSISICPGSSTTLSASGGLSYLWTPSIGLNSTIGSVVTARPTQTTTYNVRITSGTCVKDTSVIVTVLPKYPANFSVSLENTPCISFPLIKITNLTPHQDTYTYNWTITGQPTITTRDVNAFRPTFSGLFSITLRVSGTVFPSCDSVLVKTITIPPPLANTLTPSVSQPSIQCTPNTSVNLFASGGNTYSWTPTTGLSNPNISNPIATVAQTTTYTVRIGNSISGCFKDTTITVRVIPSVVPNFTVATAIDCDVMPLVTITNNSVHQIGTTYLWDFGNGQTSTLQNPPPFRYSTAGFYNIFLTTNNNTTCSRVTSRSVNIVNNSSGIDAVVTNNQAICSNEEVQLTASGGTLYSWTPTIGLDNANIATPKARPTTTTTYTVRVTRGTCFVDKSVILTVAPNVIPDFDALTSGGCGTGTLQVNLTNQTIHQTGNTYLWDFGNGQTSTEQNPLPVTYSTAGTYPITLYTNITSACPNIATKTVTLTTGGSSLTTTISPLQKICETQSTPLLATGGTSYTWTPATGLSATNIANPIANPSVTTTYSVVISNGTCQKTETVTVEVNPKPVANFASSLSEPCAVMPLVTLNNTSTLTAGNTYLWDFGNGQTSTELNPAPFRYATAGNYNITLRVRNTNGCEVVQTNPITITAPTPIVSTISPLQKICETQSTQLLATGGTNYTWTPATGLSDANIANPIASPSFTTTYSVVISNGTCQKTETVTVEVNPKPTANFTSSLSGVCGTLPLVTLTNNSVAGLGITYLWDFGNGQTSTDPTPAPFSYTTAGNYTITLRVRNSNGCEIAQTNPITIAPPTPMVTTISPLQRICATTDTQLLATGGTSYTWTPAIGLSATNIANPIANPSVTTTYSVVISNGICQKTETVTVEVSPRPIANFTLEVIDSCSTFPKVILRNLSTNADKFLWDFGNGQTSGQFNPTINYTNAGNYTIRLYAYSGKTCAFATQKNVEIRQNSPLVAIIQPFNSICKGDSVQLQASGGTRYSWSPSTGLSNANIANPKASPSQTTTYRLSILNQFNCHKDTTVTVRVFPTISANFEVSLTENCTQFPLVNIRNLSTGQENVQFLWDFGNGQTSTLQNPQAFRYDKAGDYTIRLRINNLACVAEKTYQLNYKENADFDFIKRISVSKNPKICVGDSIQLSVTGGTSYSWSPNIGLSANNIANPIAFPKNTTLYTIRVMNALGCYRDTSILVTVAPKVEVDFTVSLSSSCEDEYPLVRIIPTLQNGETYHWTFGNDSSYVGEKPPAFRYTKAGTYVIKVRGFNQICDKEQSKTIKIDRNDINFASNISVLPHKPTVCQGEFIQLQAKGGVKYLWTPATGLNNTNIPNPIAKPSSTTRYNVRIFNERGCYVDSSVLVTVAEEVKADFELKINSECGKQGMVTFLNKSVGNGEHKWTLSNGVEINDKHPKEYGFEKSGEYEVILEVFNGICRKTKSQKVRVESVLPPNVITPNGDGKNDRFVIDILQQGWKLEIYDRYGNQKFKTDNYQNDWGGDIESGTYYYLLTAPDGKNCKGWVQVLKG